MYKLTFRILGAALILVFSMSTIGVKDDRIEETLVAIMIILFLGINTIIESINKK